MSVRVGPTFPILNPTAGAGFPHAMRRILPAFGGGLMLAAAYLSGAEAQVPPGFGPNCADRDGLARTLAEAYGEEVVWWGMNEARGTVLALFVSPAATWTIVEHHANGRSCIMSSGDGMSAWAPPAGDPA